MQYSMDMIQKDGTFSVEINDNDTIYRLKIFEPGQFDRLKELPQEIQDSAILLWTPEIIAAWKLKQDKIIAEMQTENNALSKSAPAVSSEQRFEAIEAAIREMAGEIYHD